MGNPFDAEDLTQDVFLSAYKNLSRFDGTYEKAWLSKIAVRKCLDHLKAAGRRTIPTEDTYFEQLHDKEFSPEEAFLDKDFQNQIRHLCSDLKSPYREVATAHFCEEKTAAEIAKAASRRAYSLTAWTDQCWRLRLSCLPQSGTILSCLISICRR